MSRVLFMSHAAERTGPPVIMLHLARWLRANTDLEFELLFLEGGELEAEFRSLAPTHILDEWEPPRLAVLLDSLAWKVGREEWAPTIRAAFLRHRLRRIRNIDVVYINTCGSVRGLRYLRDRETATVLTHVHELSVGLEYHLPPEDHELIRSRSRHYIVVSEAVARATEQSFGVPPDMVKVRYGFVEAARARPDPAVGAASRSKLGIPDDAPVVGASGLTHWRKAPDLFVQVARLVDQGWDGPAPHFVWVGGQADGDELAPIRYDVDRSGLGDRVHFLGHQEDPIPWVQAFDLLVLPAREDAFPLVCLEAAAVGVPVVCWDNGGMPEFVGDGECGYVAHYPDLRAMADHVLTLLGDPALRRDIGARAQRRAREHHDVAVGAAAIYDELQPWL